MSKIMEVFFTDEVEEKLVIQISIFVDLLRKVKLILSKRKIIESVIRDSIYSLILLSKTF